MKIVEKRWGREEWIVNCHEYCGKLLYLKAGMISSYHYHKEKKETFYCLEGVVDLMFEERLYPLVKGSEPITVPVGFCHSFEGVTDAVLLEVSTCHDDLDVVRLRESDDNS